MADPTAHPPNMRVVGVVDGGLADPTLHGVEKASATFIISDFLQDDGSGRLDTVVGPLDGSTAAKRALLVSEAAKTGTTGADVRGTLLSTRTLLEITLTAQSGTHTLAQADQWIVFPAVKDSVNKGWYLDATPATQAGFLVVGFKDAIGTVDARVYAVPTRGVLGPNLSFTPAAATTFANNSVF